MSTNPKVSVLLAAYNHAPYVEQAVRSVLDQGFTDLELIAVDDASPDATADIIAGIDDPRLTLHRLARNRETHPRHQAAQLARGDYVAVQNSDDLWLPGKLAHQVKVLDENPETGAVFTGVVLIDDTGRQSANRSPFRAERHDRAGWLRRFFLQGNCLCHPSVLMRRHLLEAVGGYDPSLLLLGDLDLWVRLAAISDLHVIDRPLTANRMLSGARNISAETPAKAARQLFEAQCVLKRYAEPPILTHLPAVFPDRTGFAETGAGAGADHDTMTETRLRWALAQLALDGPHGEHRLFALNQMQAILSRPDEAALLPTVGGRSPLAVYSKAVADTRMVVSWPTGRSAVDAELKAVSAAGRTLLRALALRLGRRLRRAG